MRVTVTVRQPGAIHDHAAVEQAAIAFALGLQLVEEVGELLHVKTINLCDTRQFAAVASVMRNAMVRIPYSDEGIAAVAAIMGEQKGADARGVRLERQRHQVEHHPDLLLESGAFTARLPLFTDRE